MAVNFRKRVIDELIPFAEQDPRIFLLCADMGFGAIDKFKTKFPDRIINAGIMEQGSVGIAAGLAMSGMLPVYYSMPNFLAFRALEQIRNDVVLQGLNVKFIGTGANDYFKFLGKSHTCGQDDAILLKHVGVEVFDPYLVNANEETFSHYYSRWFTHPTTSYLRV